MTSNQVRVSEHLSLLILALSANVKLRTETSKLQVSLDDRNAGVHSLLEHAARVENHARHVEKLNEDLSEVVRSQSEVVRSQYEGSLSWRLTSPMRKLAQAMTKTHKP
jgi:hypothetical protein